MGYRKFTADHVFTGYDMLEQIALVTDDGGKVLDLINLDLAGDDVERLTGILSPGFINCHCHLELSHLRGVVPENRGMVNFLIAVMTGRAADSGVIGRAIAAAENEMVEKGIVAVGDVCNTTDTILQKRARNLYYYNFIEVAGFTPGAAGARFAQGQEILAQFADNASLAPHAPYSVSKDLLALIDGQNASKLLSIHNQESHAENDLFINGGGDFFRLFTALGIDTSSFRPTGMSSLKSFLPFISHGHTILLVHNSVTNAGDVQWVHRNAEVLPNIYWCLCPNANIYITGQLPDVDLLKRSGHPIVVGTDSLASNKELDILSELRTLQQHFSHLPTSELLQWATFNGAQALQISSEFGSFEKGKTPGVVLVENTSNGLLTNASSRRLL